MFINHKFFSNLSREKLIILINVKFLFFLIDLNVELLMLADLKIIHFAFEQFQSFQFKCRLGID